MKAAGYTAIQLMAVQVGTPRCGTGILPPLPSTLIAAVVMKMHLCLCQCNQQG